MKKALIGLAVTVSLMGASPVFAMTSSDTTAIDQVVITSDYGAGGLNIGGTTSSDIDRAEIAYVPSASHNICTATIDTSASTSTINDSLQMDVYRYNTAAASTTIYTNSGVSFVTTADASWQVRSTTTSGYAFTFTPCLTVVGGYQYWFTLKSTIPQTSKYYYLNGTWNGGTKTGVSKNGTGNFAFGYVLRNGSTAGLMPYGTATSNFAAYSIKLTGSENYGVSTIGSQSFSQSVVDYIAGIKDNNASSTLTTGASGFNAFSSITGFFQDRVPFGYIWDIRDLFVAAATTTSDFGTVRFDFTNTNISTNTRSWLPGNLAVFSTSTVTSLLSSGTLTALNSVVSASILVGWLIYAFYRIKSVVPTV